MNVDQLQLNFSPSGLAVLNVILALMLLGVALDIRPADFKAVLKSPRGAVVALLLQIFVVPVIAYGLTMLLNPAPSVALGMILVAACPSGNVSNYLTHLARGNTALSIGATALSTALAVIVTPVNLAFWGSLNPHTAPLLRSISLDPMEVVTTLLFLLALPLGVGMTLATKKPALAEKLRKPIQRISLVFLALFIIGAAQANFSQFMSFLGIVLLAVILENGLAFGAGYLGSLASGLNEPDRRAITIEVGIHNSGLGLMIVFNFFDGSGGMALVAAFWGVWHLVVGGALALFWSKRPINENRAATFLVAP